MCACPTLSLHLPASAPCPALRPHVRARDGRDNVYWLVRNKYKTHLRVYVKEQGDSLLTRRFITERESTGRTAKEPLAFNRPNAMGCSGREGVHGVRSAARRPHRGERIFGRESFGPVMAAALGLPLPDGHLPGGTRDEFGFSEPRTAPVSEAALRSSRSWSWLSRRSKRPCARAAHS